MITRITICTLLVMATQALAKSPDVPDFTVFAFEDPPELGPQTQHSQGGFSINDLGISNAFRAQSRAVEFLSREFSRAAAQGLIEAHETPAAPISGFFTGDPKDRSNLSVVTGINRDVLARATVPPTDTGIVCLRDQDVDLTRWGDTSDPKYLGKLRTAAIAENGDITSSGAIRLARYYIALGFGAEALAMAQFIEKDATHNLVLAMAEILDHGRSDSPILRGQIFCKGAVSLWAALASPLGLERVPRNANDILATFSGLPFHLRSHLGPLLAERLRNAGLEEQARNVLNAITRGGTHTVESTLVAAKLGLTGTQPDQSRTKLLELSRGTDVTAAEALLELLDDADRHGLPPDFAWVKDVPSLVRATEGTEVSASLNIAGFHGMISLGLYDEVRLAIKEDGPGLTSKTREELALRALISATQNAPDAAFLRSELGLSKVISNSALSREDALALAARLSDLSLAHRALPYLPQNPETVEEILTSSSVLSATGQNAAALGILEAAPRELLPQLGGLLVEEGDVDRALMAFTESGQIGPATLLAARAGRWDWIAKSGSERVSDATQALLDPPEQHGTEPANGKLLQQAQNRRLQAKQLLELLNSPELSGAFTN